MTVALMTDFPEYKYHEETCTNGEWTQDNPVLTVDQVFIRRVENMLNGLVEGKDYRFTPILPSAQV